MSIKHIACCFAFLPNAFTPNADGNNDIFKLEATGSVRLEKMIVYNRYGQVVWGGYNQAAGWDGSQ